MLLLIHYATIRCYAMLPLLLRYLPLLLTTLLRFIISMPADTPYAIRHDAITTRCHYGAIERGVV